MLVVAPQEVADELADVHAAAWPMEYMEGEGGSRRMLLCVEVTECLRWSVQVVAAVVAAEGEFAREVDVVAEMVGEMGVVIMVS